MAIRTIEYAVSANSTPVEGSIYANNYIYIGETWYFNSAKKITEAMLDAKVLWYAWGQKKPPRPSAIFKSRKAKRQPSMRRTVSL